MSAGYAVPIGSHASPNDGEPYYADMTDVNPYDPNKAKQLLQQAGQTKLTLRLAQIPYPLCDARHGHPCKPAQCGWRGP
jgi:peptide/nickel transport system substrate-binding protein